MSKKAMWERDRARVVRSIEDILVEHLEGMRLLTSIRMGREAMRAWRELRALPPTPAFLARTDKTIMKGARQDEWLSESLRIFGTELVEDPKLHPMAVVAGDVAASVEFLG